MLSDPLTSIKHELSRTHPSSRGVSVSSVNYTSHSSEDRIRRESKERARAMELIRKRQKEKERELLGSVCMTPSTVYSEHTSGYRDVYNPRETEEAHRQWERKTAPVERYALEQLQSFKITYLLLGEETNESDSVLSLYVK